MENFHLTKEQQFNQEDRQLRNAMDREAENKAKYIELSEFKNKADVYYQQLTKASKQKGLGSHEHIYFTYGIEWAFNHLPQSEVNKNDLILNLQLQNSILLNVLKEIAVKYPEDMTTEQDTILVKYLIAIAGEALRKVEQEPGTTS